MKSHGMAVFTLTLIATAPVPADALQTMAQNNPRPDSDYIRAEADRDGDSQISRDEVQYLHGTGDGRGAWRIINRHFDEFDSNADGRLSLSEISSGFSRPEIEAERVIRAEGLRSGVAR